MQVTVQGHHIDTGEALNTYVNEKLAALNEKYFNRAVSATVTMSKEKQGLFKSNISMSIGKDIVIQATATEYDVHQAFDAATDKIAKQLRRYKRRERRLPTPCIGGWPESSAYPSSSRAGAGP